MLALRAETAGEALLVDVAHLNEGFHLGSNLLISGFIGFSEFSGLVEIRLETILDEIFDLTQKAFLELSEVLDLVMLILVEQSLNFINNFAHFIISLFKVLIFLVVLLGHFLGQLLKYASDVLLLHK